MTTTLPAQRQAPIGELRDPSQLREALGIPFTDEQLLAASAPLAPGVIVAGAGSGKTSVMAARVVWLVGTGQVQPERVLGLTFTSKAAGELSSRITGALDRAGLTGPAASTLSSDGVLTEPGLPTVSTYHAFAGRLFTEHALRLGLEPGARLLADATRFQLAARVLRRHRGPLRALTSPLRMLVGDLVSLEGELSEHLRDPAEVLAFEDAWIAELEAALEAQTVPGVKNAGHLGDLRAMLESARKRRELTVLAGELRTAKRQDNLVDFADQVAFGALLAEQHPVVGIAERAAAGVVLLDEYQDTSVAQRRMLAGLFGGGHPVTAVGDPCQAIYGWRGASVSNLDGFPEHFPTLQGDPATAYSLAVNQRSGGRLLTLANRLTESLRARHRVVQLTPPPGREAEGATLLALHETYPQEITWVAERIAELVAGGVPARECAVLVRVRSDFPALRDALTAAGLPVEIVGLGGLLELPEVRDLVSTLEVLADPTANAALVRLLTGPRWRLGLRDMAALGVRARELIREGAPDRRREEQDHDALLADAAAGADSADLVALADALLRPGVGLSPEAANRVSSLGHEIQQLRRHLGEPLLDLVHRVLRTTGLGIEVALADAADGGRRGASIEAFLDVVAGFNDLDGQSNLAAFLAYLAAAQEHDRGLDVATPSGAEAVQVMTVHRAKGLEWDVVALPNLTSKVFPGERNDRRWVRSAKMLPGPLRGDAEDIPELLGMERADLAAHKQESSDVLDRDERRLGYVAVTRARHTLIASSHWWGPTQKRVRGPSPYLELLHAEARPAEVAIWVAQPPASASNPVVAAQEELSWPAPADVALLARRSGAASAIATRSAQLRVGVVEDDPGARLAPDDGLTEDERTLFAALDEETELLVEAERRDRQTTRLVPLPASLSASQLLALRSDPDGLARSLARPLPRRPVSAARRGTRFHAWVETLWDQVPLLAAEELTGAGDDDLGDDDLASLQEAFLSSEYAGRAPLALEAPFSLPLAGRTIIGRIDAVYEGSGGFLGNGDLGSGRYEVVDWKTGSEAADPLQLAIYRLAWARLQGVPVADVDAAFFYVATGRVVRPELPDEAELLALLSPGSAQGESEAR